MNMISLIMSFFAAKLSDDILNFFDIFNLVRCLSSHESLAVKITRRKQFLGFVKVYTLKKKIKKLDQNFFHFVWFYSNWLSVAIVCEESSVFFTSRWS